MALAVNRTGVILEKRDLSYHRPRSARRCATASYQHTWPANTIDKRPAAAARSPEPPISTRSTASWRARSSSARSWGAVPPTGSVSGRAARSGSSWTPAPRLAPLVSGAIISLPLYPVGLNGQTMRSADPCMNMLATLLGCAFGGDLKLIGLNSRSMIAGSPVAMINSWDASVDRESGNSGRRQGPRCATIREALHGAVAPEYCPAVAGPALVLPGEDLDGADPFHREAVGCRGNGAAGRPVRNPDVNASWAGLIDGSALRGIPGSSTVSSGNELAAEVYWTSDTSACFEVTTSLPTFPIDDCGTIGHSVQHDTSSAEWFMEDPLPQKSPDAIGTCNAGSRPNGILAYPANPAGSSFSGTFDSNTNSVSGCASG
jgi:hypothetical protein